MSVEEMKLTFDIVQTVLIAIIGIMNWLNNRQRVTNATINKLENATKAAIGKLEDSVDGRLDKHAEQITRLEVDMRNAPSHNDLGKIYDEIRNQSRDIADVGKSVEKLVGAFEPLEKLVTRMDQFWRAGGNNGNTK